MPGNRIALVLTAVFAAWAPAQDPPAPGPAPAPDQAAGAGRGGGLPAGATREREWWPPTQEDWRKPVLVRFQRSWDDAQALAAASGRPILACVNMDGEIASEHYAGVRYRQPEIAALYAGYVCVIGSVYRHNPHDFDQQGRRIECPRFGSVTCGEHIAIEPLLYERFFEGQRVAPRHVGVELDGAEAFDVFYAWSTQAVFDAIRDGLADRPAPTPAEVGDRSLLDLVSSRDARDREALESAYQRAPRDQQRALLEAALAAGPAAPLDLLRLALPGADPELAALARRALLLSDDERAIELLVAALDAPLALEERGALIEALDRLGGTWSRARTLAMVYRGLDDASAALDAQAWEAALAAPAADGGERVARLEQQDAVLASDDAQSHLQLAEGFLALAEREPDPASARLLARDARDSAEAAQRLGAYGGRLQAALALADLALGDEDAARARAEAALPGLLADSHSRGAATLLDAFAQSRLVGIAAAVRERRDWPPSWLSDVQAAFDVLARHPHGEDRQVALHHDFLRWFRAQAEAAQALERGLLRFPASALLHDRLRTRLLQQGGLPGLQAGYERRLAEPGAPPELHGWAGYAALVAAEAHRRAGRATEAEAAYVRGVAHYERSIEHLPARRDEADHYVALALAGRARLAFERGDWDGALDGLLASFERRPDAAATPDGLNLTPLDTARVLLARLRDLARDDQAARLAQAVERLDARLLQPPAYERAVPPDLPGALRGPPRPQ